MVQTPDRFPGEDVDELLETDPDEADTTYTPTYTGERITRESWFHAASGHELKRIDYTYSGDVVSTEVRTVYDPADGTTIVARKTITYSHSGTQVTGATIVRND